MKLFLFFFLAVLASGSILGQTVNAQYDTALARKLEADDYGMKMYVLVILKTGSNKTKEKVFIDSCFRGHLTNIQKLADSKQLIVAGPFGKNETDFRGLFILNVKTVEEADKLLQTDPAIKTNLLKAELYPWYGSAALPEYFSAHDKIWKSKP